MSKDYSASHSNGPDFHIQGPGFSAHLHYNYTAPFGTIKTDSEAYNLQFQGSHSNSYALTLNDKVRYKANRLSGFGRRLVITDSNTDFLMKSVLPISRVLEITGPETNFRITPKSFLTQKSSIHGQWQDDILACFVFWIAVDLWRQSGRDSEPTLD